MAKDLPPLMIVCGTSDFLCRRSVMATLKQARSMGYEVSQADLDSLADQLNGLMVMFGDGTRNLFWVRATSKVDADVIQAQSTAGPDAPRLLLWYDGEPDARTAFAKSLDKFPKGMVKRFTAPSDFKADGEAAIFLVNEMKGHGYALGAELAQAVVDRAGNDLGVLYFEALKLSLLLKANGATEITPQHVAQTLASLGDATSIQFIEALRGRNPKQISRILTRTRRMATNGSGAVKELVGRSLSTLLLALQTADYHERGKDPKESAALVGQNPWYLENKVLPFSKAWGKQRLTDLVRHFCKSDRLVMSGAVDPWTSFEVGILKIATSDSR